MIRNFAAVYPRSFTLIRDRTIMAQLLDWGDVEELPGELSSVRQLLLHALIAANIAAPSEPYPTSAPR